MMKRRDFIRARSRPNRRSQVGRGQGERHPQGRQQEGRKAQGARRESKIKIEQNNADQ